MNIQKIEIFSVDFPLVKPFIVSYGTFPVMPSIIVKLTTSEGFIGWGKACRTNM